MVSYLASFPVIFKLKSLLAHRKYGGRGDDGDDVQHAHENDHVHVYGYGHGVMVTFMIMIVSVTRARTRSPTYPRRARVCTMENPMPSGGERSADFTHAKPMSDVTTFACVP